MTASPYPASFMGNPYLFGGALFAMMLMTLFSLMLAPIFAKQLWNDRRDGFSSSNAFCWTIFTICITMVILCGPEAVWMINYADLTEHQRIVLANIKRTLEQLALIFVAVWISTLIMWKDEIILKLKSPDARVWIDARFRPLMRVLPLFVLCILFALCVTLGRAFA